MLSNAFVSYKNLLFKLQCCWCHGLVQFSFRIHKKTFRSAEAALKKIEYTWERNIWIDLIILAM